MVRGSARSVTDRAAGSGVAGRTGVGGTGVNVGSGTTVGAGSELLPHATAVKMRTEKSAKKKRRRVYVLGNARADDPKSDAREPSPKDFEVMSLFRKACHICRIPRRNQRAQQDDDR